MANSSAPQQNRTRRADTAGGPVLVVAGVLAALAVLAAIPALPEAIASLGTIDGAAGAAVLLALGWCSAALRAHEADSDVDLSFTAVVLLCAAVFVGPAGAAALGAAVSAFGVGGRVRAVNVGMTALVGGVAGWVYRGLGGADITVLAGPAGRDLVTEHATSSLLRIVALPLVAADVALVVVNVAVLACLFRISGGSARSAVAGAFARNVVIYLAYSLIAFTFVVLWGPAQTGPVTAVLVVAPLLVARWAYRQDVVERAARTRVLQAVGAAADGRDGSPRRRARLRALVRVMAAELGLPPAARVDLARAAELHDLGMIAVPPEALDADTFTPATSPLRDHSVAGEEMLAPLGFLGPVPTIVRHHHERVDGRGYPDGLAGDEIPLGARVLAVADVYEAAAWPGGDARPGDHDGAARTVQRAAGTHLDGDVVDALVRALAVRDPATWLDGVGAAAAAGAGGPGGPAGPGGAGGVAGSGGAGGAVGPSGLGGTGGPGGSGAVAAAGVAEPPGPEPVRPTLRHAGARTSEALAAASDAAASDVAASDVAASDAAASADVVGGMGGVASADVVASAGGVASVDAAAATDLVASTDLIVRGRVRAGSGVSAGRGGAGLSAAGRRDGAGAPTARDGHAPHDRPGRPVTGALVVLRGIAVSVGCATVLAAGVLAASAGEPAPHREMLVAVAVLLLGAERLRVHPPAGPPIAYAAAAVGIGLALSSGPGAVEPATLAEVLGIAAGASLLDLLARRASAGPDPSGPSTAGSRDEPAGLGADAVLRWVTLLLVAGVVRLDQGGVSLLATFAGRPGWWTALVATGLVVTALLVEWVLRSAWEARRSRVDARHALRSVWAGCAAMGAATGATGILVGIAQPAVGLAALPLVAAPLVVAQMAVRRQAHVRAAYRDSLLVLSRLPELAGAVPRGHADAVADVAERLGRRLGLGGRPLARLQEAALLHDIGQVGLPRPIPGGATVLAAPADQERIAARGAAVVRRAGADAAVAAVVADQAVAYHEVVHGRRRLGLEARILKVANAFDDHRRGHRDATGLAGVTGRAGATGASGPTGATGTFESEGRAADRDEVDRARVAAARSALERLYLGYGHEFDPRVVDALAGVDLAALAPDRPDARRGDDDDGSGPVDGRSAASAESGASRASRARAHDGGVGGRRRPTGAGAAAGRAWPTAADGPTA